MAEYAEIPIELLKIDVSYQRDLDEGRIKRLLKAFDAGAIKALSVSRRLCGSLYVYDGQHTLAVFKAMRAKTVPALVVDGDREMEARWFMLMNGAGVSKATARDAHRAAVVARDDTAIMVQGLLDSLGLEVAKGGARAGTLSAIGTLQSWAKQDFNRLDRAMGMVHQLWANESHAWTQVVLRGAWDIAADADVMRRVISGCRKHKVTPRRILDAAAGMQMATGMPGGGSGYAKQAYLRLAGVKA